MPGFAFAFAVFASPALCLILMRPAWAPDWLMGLSLLWVLFLLVRKD